jgi:hypothetical protein
MGAAKNAITDHDREDWPQALAAPAAKPSYWERRARLAEKQYTLAVNALEQIAAINVAGWQQPAARIQDIAHDALDKIDVLTAEHDKTETPT